ncbi:hypothetical protein BDW59DRAFT_168799 [Aspergillus cavernicola]|uniref:Fe2OG dioxygenase domain-containing protein n=1 Tax=Aspergillus cavernicola TaxID=176166 RepID=A0ABR4J100_9EURO
MSQRSIPAISLRAFENRKDEIGKELVDAAENIGFFTVVDHVLSVEEIEEQFAVSKRYFSQPYEKKMTIPHDTNTSLGYERNGQYRPGSGFDQKESFFVRPRSQWPSDEDVSGFSESTDGFLTNNYFKEAMDVTKDDCTNQLRLLHYPDVEKSAGGWRHGNHTDIGCLTLVFQRDGEDGLEVMPGRETHTSAIHGDDFFPIPAKTGPIVVNIGDMLMAWSDDRFKANWHRVRANPVGFSPERYSLGYFNMGREDFVFQGTLKKYPAITCGEYFHNHIKKQFA